MAWPLLAAMSTSVMLPSSDKGQDQADFAFDAAATAAGG
jgi:hypothetical protein